MSDQPKVPSERSFGFVFAAFFFILGMWPAIGGARPRLSLIAVAAILLALALLAPNLLRPFNLLWYRFGLFLHKIVSPLVLGLLFLVVVTPIGVAARLFGVNLLQRRKPAAQSYWLPRSRSDAPDASMRDQF
jgi:hypothetical protein